MRKLRTKIKSKIGRNLRSNFRVGEASPVESVPVVMFAADPALDADDFNAKCNFRVICTLTEDMQTQFRVTIEPGLTGGGMLTTIHVGAGKYDTSEPNYPNVIGSIVETLFQEASGFTQKTTPQTSDWTDVGDLVGMVTGDQVLVSYRTGIAGEAAQKYNAAATNAFTFFQSDDPDTYWNVSNTIGLGFNPLLGKNYSIVKIETRTGVGSGVIPMAWDELRYVSNIAGGAGPFTSGTQANKDWNDSPGYANGNQCFIWAGDGADVFTMQDCRVDWREGPRIGSGATPTATFNVDGCYIKCHGVSAEDHADGIQGYSPGGVANVNVTSTHFRAYSDAEAVSVFGPNAVGSDCFRWADGLQGTITFRNVICEGGARGVSIYADSGTTHISFENVYFVASPGGWGYYDYDIRATAGTLVVDKWVNVRAATIVDGVLVPGALLPSP